MRAQEDVRQPQRDTAEGEMLSDMLKSVLGDRTKSWICFWLCRSRSVRVRSIPVSLWMTVAVW